MWTWLQNALISVVNAINGAFIWVFNGVIQILETVFNAMLDAIGYLADFCGVSDIVAEVVVNIGPVLDAFWFVNMFIPAIELLSMLACTFTAIAAIQAFRWIAALFPWPGVTAP